MIYWFIIFKATPPGERERERERERKRERKREIEREREREKERETLRRGEEYGCLVKHIY